MKENIVVVFGGKSTEHDISILSAIQIMSAIDRSKYNVLPIYITHAGKWLFGDKLCELNTYSNFDEKKFKEVAILPSDDHLFFKGIFGFKMAQKIDAIIISMHGKNGEDGTIQGLFELANIPYSSCGVLSSSVGLYKDIMKQIFLQNKIPITEYISISKNKYLNNFDIKDIFKKIDFPLVVKPNTLGSSIGISLVKNDDELKDAIDLAFKFDSTIIIEKCVENLKEVNIAVLGDMDECIVSMTEEVTNSGGLLSFEKKYLSQNGKANQTDFNKKMCNSSPQKLGGAKNGMQNLDRIMPASITKKQAKEIEFLAKKIFEVTRSKGVVRIDFMIDTKTGKVYANEINCIPGSFAFYLWQKQGIGFDKLAERLIEIAKKTKSKKEKLLSVFESNVIKKVH